MRSICMVILGTVVAASIVCPLNAVSAANAYAQWNNGPSDQDDFFPITVWLQSPHNAARYKAAGFNTYIGLWQGPTEAHLAELKGASSASAS